MGNHEQEELEQEQPMRVLHCTEFRKPTIKTTNTEQDERESDEDACIVYLQDDLIDSSTEKQLKAMMTYPQLHHIRVMPDCHVGNGCCVGFTSHIDCKRVVPAFVGGDIGCGILCYSLGTSRLNLNRVEKNIKSTIPMGGGHWNMHETPPVETTYVERFLEKAQKDVDHFTAAMKVTPPCVDMDYFHRMCDKIGADVTASLRAFGTLGSGNHFIEINKDTQTEENFLTIHSGSRAFGMKLFEYHNRKVDKTQKCLQACNSIEYCCDLIIAQHLAIMNRRIMLQLILRVLDIEYTEELVMESIHNYIDFSTFGQDSDTNMMGILRKGAISAKANETCIVALNMRDGILVCRGKGNSEWNQSCAHGCGRIMSRSEARRRIRMKDYIQSMKAVVSTSVAQETIDEAPQAYKDMAIIMKALQPTVTIEKHLVAVINLKGTD